MKKLYFFALLLLPFILAAQKSVDLDRYRFTVQYRSLPQLRLDSTYRTYNVEIEGTQLMQSFLQELSPEKTVLLEGWRKLAQNGHISINVKLGDLLPESVSVKERAESIKNKNGQVTGTRIFYHQEVVYTFDAAAAITDYKGIHVMDQQLADRQYKQVYKSPEFAIKHLAEGYFVLNSLSITKDLYRSCVNRAMHYLSERITDNFGFSEATANDFMSTPSKFKKGFPIKKNNTINAPEMMVTFQAFRPPIFCLMEISIGTAPTTSITANKIMLTVSISFVSNIRQIINYIRIF